MTNYSSACLRIAVLWCVFAAFGLAQDPPGPAEDYSHGQEGISLHVEQMPLAKLMKLLSLNERVNIICSGALAETVCLNIYDLSLEQVLEAALKPHGYSFHLLDGAYLVMKTKELEGFLFPPSPQEVRIFRLNYLTMDEAEKFLQPLLSETGAIVKGEKPAEGLGSGESETGGESSASTNVILVKDYAEILELVEGALEELDLRPRQVLVEATILEVTLDEICKLGVDFNALGGLSFEDVGSTSNLYSVTTGDISSFDDTVWAGTDTGFATDTPTEGFSFGILNDKVGLFIEALENVVDTNVIANPKLLALNRQRAEIIIGGRLGYYGTETMNDSVTQQNVEFLDTGTQLRLRPFIAGDGFVRLEIHPQRSSGVVDPVTGLPSETTSEVTTNIMIKDGDTVVIGGLIETHDSKIDKHMPFFGSLPLIGWLFRYEETETRRTEIIVMITPHILDPENANIDAEAEVAEFDQRKRLFREGFLFCSRTLSTLQHLDSAEACLEDGSIGWAEFHLDRVIALDPNNHAVVPLMKKVEAARKGERMADEPMEDYLWSQLQ